MFEHLRRLFPRWFAARDRARADADITRRRAEALARERAFRANETRNEWIFPGIAVGWMYASRPQRRASWLYRDRSDPWTS